METIDNLYTWQGLFFTTIVLIALYWLLKFCVYIINFVSKKFVSKKLIFNILSKILLLYKPIAAIIIMLNFISINYITHTIILAVISLFGYHYLLNFIHGIFLKMNTLIQKGTVLQIEDYKGDVRRMLPFGILLNTEKGERFFNYSVIEKSGFTIISLQNSKFRQTLYLQTEKSIDTILDILFDNPILSMDDRPVLNYIENEETTRLQYTLELGASKEDLIAFLNNHEIKTSLTNNKIINN